MLASETAIPPVGAGPERVIVPVELDPPTTVVGFMERLTSVSGTILRSAWAEDVGKVAVTMTSVAIGAAVVWQLKLTVEEPAGTVTDEGPPH